MRLSFSNRKIELQELDTAADAGGLLVLFGRRRVGKTRLLRHWLQQRDGLYSQAIEASRDIQIEQVFRDIREKLSTSLEPKSWIELFELLSLQKQKGLVFCLDEFPYLVASDPSLPSVLQRWLDHQQPDGSLLVLSGSSTKMMNDLFLNRSAPLYGRARKLLHIRPMNYGAFCQACRLKPADKHAFERFSLVGGIPKYWEFVDAKKSVLALADELFFGFSPYLEQEPARLLRDEAVAGMNAVSVLEAIGRGARKPSEIAARLGIPQTNISRLLQQLMDASILERELPFGENLRSTKKVHYSIQDPTLRFWFRVYSPHRTRWQFYSDKEKALLLHEHAATVFEDFHRQRYPGAARYWEKDLEFDLVRLERTDDGREQAVVSEVKWRNIPAREKPRLLKHLNDNWQRSTLGKRYPNVALELIDASLLKQI
jgi:uncharacterized protein